LEYPGRKSEVNSYSSPLTTPLDFSTARRFPDSEGLKLTHSKKFSLHRYGRDSSPVAMRLEHELEEWHPGLKALIFSSGMAAIETLMHWAWLHFKNVAIQAEVYRKTEVIASGLSVLAPRNMHRISHDDRNLPREMKDGPLFTFLETPSNPHLRVLGPSITTSSRRIGDLTAVDATLSGLGALSPAFLQSIDILVYSLSKYIGGHNDVLGGALFVPEDLYGDFWELRSRMGNILAPADAFLISRSLRTLALRMESQEANAREILPSLREFQSQRTIRSIFYPGSDANNDQAELAEQLLLTKGSVVSFEPSAPREVLAHRLKDLRTVKLAPSFGSVDSLIEICSLMSRPDLGEDELRSQGLEPSLIRLSVGLEPSNKIIEDLYTIVKV
jgi:cystathionine gamma-synthase